MIKRRFVSESVVIYSRLMVTIMLGLLFVSGCEAGGAGSVKPGNDPGMCPLNCGKAMIASNDPQFSIVGVESVNLTCASTQTEYPLNWYYRVVEEYFVGEQAVQRPVPLISFAVHAGGVAVLGEENDPSVTSLELRCSDMCGVIGFDIIYRCPEAGQAAEYTTWVSSGGLFSNVATISINTVE